MMFYFGSCEMFYARDKQIYEAKEGKNKIEKAPRIASRTWKW